MDMANDAF